MEKRYLFTPGPTPVPPEVLAAGAEPIVHHRGADFREIYERTLGRLRTSTAPSPTCCSSPPPASGAMESAVANLCAPGDRVAVVSHGSFGERWIAICEQHGARRAGDPLRVGRDSRPGRGRRGGARVGRRARASASSPTPRPASSPTCARSRRRSARRLLVVDAISSLGAVPLETDAWGIDVVVSGSQKALMCPPGLATVSVPEHVLARVEAVAQLLLRLARQQEGAGQARRGVHAGRLADPQPRRRARPDSRRRARGCVRAPHPARPRRARGHQGDGPRALLARRRHARPSSPRCARRTGSTATSCCAHLRDQHGVTLAPGQAHLKGKIFRIGHIGWFDVFDIATALAAVELSLIELGAGDRARRRGRACVRGVRSARHGV